MVDPATFEGCNRSQTLPTLAPSTTTSTLAPAPPPPPVVPVCKKNVLFIMCDDLRFQINPKRIEGTHIMSTPNFDLLAGKSVFFPNAACQVGLCAPSRASMLTSRRPDTTRVWDLATYWRSAGGNFTTIPQYFRSIPGYKVQSVGKIFHGGTASGGGATEFGGEPDDLMLSWDDYYHSPNDVYYEATGPLRRRRLSPEEEDAVPPPLPGCCVFNDDDTCPTTAKCGPSSYCLVKAHCEGSCNGRWCDNVTSTFPDQQAILRAYDTIRKGCPRCGNSWADVPPAVEALYPLPDTQNTDEAVRLLTKEWKESDNFFLAVGFHKPHLPFVAPARFYDMYPLEEIKMPPNPDTPEGMPDIAWSESGEMVSYPDITAELGHSNGFKNHTERLKEQTTLELRRAYYACVSHMDEQLGRVLDAIDSGPFAQNTIITLVGDHGYVNGHHGQLLCFFLRIWI